MISFLIKYWLNTMRIMMPLCDRALRHSHKSSLFWRIASRKLKSLCKCLERIHKRCSSSLPSLQWSIYCFRSSFLWFIDVFVGFRCRRPATAFVILDRLTKTWATHKSYAKKISFLKSKTPLIVIPKTEYENCFEDWIKQSHKCDAVEGDKQYQFWWINLYFWFSE